MTVTQLFLTDLNHRVVRLHRDVEVRCDVQPRQITDDPGLRPILLHLVRKNSSRCNDDDDERQDEIKPDRSQTIEKVTSHSDRGEIRSSV